MTQADLAAKANFGSYGQSQIARIENGTRVPTWDSLARIAAALGCMTINELLGPMPVARSDAQRVRR